MIGEMGWGVGAISQFTATEYFAVSLAWLDIRSKAVALRYNSLCVCKKKEHVIYVRIKATEATDVSKYTGRRKNQVISN
jgi:hypothetical protein